MSQSLLDDIVDIVSSMSPQETRSAYQYLGAFTKKPSDLPTLLMNITQEDDNSFENLCNSHYVQKKPRAVSKRLEVLRSKLLLCLRLDVNINRPNVYANSFKTLVKNRGLLENVEIMHMRGKVKLSKKLLNQIINDSKKFEHYDLIIQAIRYKKMAGQLWDKAAQKEELEAEIDFYADVRKYVDLSLRLYYECSAHEYKDSPLLYDEKMKQSLNQLEAYSKLSNSTLARYYLLLTTVNYHFYAFRFADAQKTTQELRNLVLNEPPLQLDRAYYAMYIHEAFVNIGNEKLNDVSLICKQARKYCVQDSFNYFLSLELEVIALIRCGELVEANKIIQTTIKKLVNQTKSPVKYSKFKYYEGIINFIRRKHQLAHQNFNETEALNIDKDGWSIYIQIMLILNHTKRNKLDSASRGIENLLRTYKRIKKVQKIRSRTETILIILKHYNNTGFNINKTVDLCSNELEFLEMKSNPEYSHKPVSPEVIPFQKLILENASLVEEVQF